MEKPAARAPARSALPEKATAILSTAGFRGKATAREGVPAPPDRRSGHGTDDALSLLPWRARLGSGELGGTTVSVSTTTAASYWAPRREQDMLSCGHWPAPRGGRRPVALALACPDSARAFAASGQRARVGLRGWRATRMQRSAGTNHGRLTRRTCDHECAKLATTPGPRPPLHWPVVLHFLSPFSLISHHHALHGVRNRETTRDGQLA